MPYNEECEQQQELYWNEVFDEDDDDIFGAYRAEMCNRVEKSTITITITITS
jgi:hypothetical protein